MTKAKAPVDFTTLHRARTYEWHEMEREGQEPLRAKFQNLTLKESDALPIKAGVSMEEGLNLAAPFVAEWNLTAETEGGEVVNVPPPSEAGGAVIHSLMTFEEASWLYNQLKFGHVLKLTKEKKALKASDTTPVSSSGHASPDGA